MPRINETEKSIELPQLNRTNQSNPATEARNITKQALSQSNDALTQQVQALVNKMDASDRNLARQLAGYIADRPTRFTQIFAAELQAAMNPQESAFIDVEAFQEPTIDLGGWQAIAPSTALGCLPM